MSHALAAGGLLKMRVWTTFPTEVQSAVNTNWYVVSSVGALPATDQDAATALDALVAAEYKAILTSLATYNGVQAQICSPIGPYTALFVAADVISSAGPGTVVGPPMPTQISGLASYETSQAGVANRGRMYAAFPGQSADSGGGTVSGAYDTALGALAANMSAGISISTAGRTAILVRVLNHGRNKAGLFPTPAQSPITGFKVSPFWATQRRRGEFGRTNRSPI
jgi:hypothetical protein